MTAGKGGGRSGAANRVRIIGGVHRSRMLTFPPREGLRPSPDRVRETLFNWLGQDLTGLCCLDLFAGSGALGFEAASRGARTVVMVERDPQIAAALRDNAARLPAPEAEIVAGDALEFLRRDRRVHDVVFLDPPFATADHPKLLAALDGRLAVGARVYVESPRMLDLPPGWSLVRRLTAGHVHAHLIRPDDDEKRGVPGDVRPHHPRP